MEPAWTLTGGGALAGVHLGHRTTRDLDLFWLGRGSLGEARREVSARLRAAGLEVTDLRTTDAFASLQVQSEACAESVVVDLVAEPAASIESPQRIEFGGATIQVDTPHEILVNELCALLHRSELRDLIDIDALLRSGLDLERAIEDAPKKDGGFSALTLGFTLKGWQIGEAARAAGFGAQAAELERFRDDLLARVAGGPNQPPGQVAPGVRSGLLTAGLQDPDGIGRSRPVQTGGPREVDARRVAVPLRRRRTTAGREGGA